MKYFLYGIGICCAVIIVAIPYFFSIEYESYKTDNQALASINIPPPFVVTHLKTPESVKALYASSWVAGNKKLRNNLINIIDSSELNSIVIDIKDYTGYLSFIPENPELKNFESGQNRIVDIKQFIGELHEKGVYVIGRISVFQDSYLVHTKPEYAVKTKSKEVWKDYKGVSWLDVGAKPVWDYIALIGNEAYNSGFDELNFDYIRFPSDGNMLDIEYSFGQGIKKSEAMKNFFAFLDESFRPRNIPISADLFGMTTSNTDDLGIGQVLEDALAHFDFVSPMVYPSHYPPNFIGIANPASEPYKVIRFALSRGVERAILASSTPLKIRPWLQDFSIYKTYYTPEMIRAEKQATYGVGLNSWMLWNASGIYTVVALDPAYAVATSTAVKISTSTLNNINPQQY